MALGKLVFEGKGKITRQRVLDIVKGGAKIEALFIRPGKMNGFDVTNTGTLGVYVFGMRCLLWRSKGHLYHYSRRYGNIYGSGIGSFY